MPFRANHQQLAELLRAGHVEGAGLEGGVGDHGADVHAVFAIAEATNAGDHAAWRLAALQRFFDGESQAGEAVRVGTDEIAVEFLEVVEEMGHESAWVQLCGTFAALQHVADLQIPIRLHQAVPEVLAAADVARRDAAVVAPPSALRLQVGGEQPLEQERDDHEQGVRDAGGGALLPLLHIAEEAADGARRALVPVEELRL